MSSCPILPKGLIDHRGAYVIKGKRSHQDLLQVGEVREWKLMLNSRLEQADKFEKRVIAKELAKLERKDG